MSFEQQNSALSDSDLSQGNGNTLNDDQNTRSDQRDLGPQTVAEKILLTSRRIKKTVTISEAPPTPASQAPPAPGSQAPPTLDSQAPPTQGSQDMEDAVDRLESNFMDGVKEIRDALKLLMSEKKTFEVHIKSLEDSLRKSGQENAKARNVMQLMKNEIEMLTAKLEAVKVHNAALQNENKNLQSDHEDHLKTIADRHRRKVVEKKTFQKWKGKVNNGVVSKSQLAELLEENRRLKMELLQYQESAKYAFLRSANVLNSEALTLFQDAATRRLDNQTPNESSHENSFGESSSSGLDQPSDLGQGPGPNRGKENELSASRIGDSFKRRSSREGIKRNFEYLSDDSRTNERKKNLTGRSKSQMENNYDRKTNPTTYRQKDHIKEFVPEPLRQETRQIMKNLETNKWNRSEHNKSHKDSAFCLSKSHVHICHCTPLPGQPGNCPYCFAHQKYNFKNMPVASKTKSKSSGVQLDKNKSGRVGTNDNVVVDRSKVIFKPSGSSVIIEKHL